MESNGAVTLHFEDLAVKNYLFLKKMCAFVGENIKMFTKALLMDVKFFFFFTF